MIPKQNRLKKMKDFDILFKQGNFVPGDLVNVKKWKIAPEKYPKRECSKQDLKIGFVVGTKIHKGAVKRNRIKRQMRAVVRELLVKEKIKSGYMLAIMAKPEILGQNYINIKESIEKVLKRGKIMKNS